MPIRARIETDDGRYSLNFNPTLWFNFAGAEDIIALEASGWNGDAARVVVEFLAARGSTKLRPALSYCRRNGVGYKIFINKQDADLWLTLCRPLLQDRIRDAAREQS